MKKITASIFPAAASTNALLREKAAAGAPEGCVLIAGSQTEGRGRTGRRFYSPPDTGLYMSLLLRPFRCPAQKARKYTVMAAVAACKAIESLSDRKPLIKWVNDIYMDGKVTAPQPENLPMLRSRSLSALYQLCHARRFTSA